MTDPIARAQQARQAMEFMEPVFAEVLNATFAAFLQTSPGNTEQLTALTATGQAIEALKMQCRSIIDAGLIAEKSAE